MLKTKASLEIEIAGKIYTFICDADSALTDIHKALIDFKTFVAGRIAESQPPVTQTAASPPPEEPKEQA
jgi:hypothetical protein